MDQQATFRFHGGPSHSRTPRISKEAWKKHEATIRELFPSSTLRELMDIMETQHGFKATEKQYIHQLPKWGLHKRVVKQGAPAGRSPSNAPTERGAPQPTDPGGHEGVDRDSPPSPFASTPGTQSQYTLSPQYEPFPITLDGRLDLPPDAYTPRDYQPAFGGKRSRSIVSLGSQMSGRSTRERIKRSKLWSKSPVTSPKAPGTTDCTASPWAAPSTGYEYNLPSPDSYRAGGLGMESPWSPDTTIFSSMGTTQDPPETPETAVSDPPDDALLLHHSPPLEFGFNHWTTAELHEALEAATQQVFQKTLSDDPRIRVLQRHKLALQLSRLAETLLGRAAASWQVTEETTRGLRDVAEYLQAVGMWTDAFYLYALLLRAAEEDKPGQPEHDAGGPLAPWSRGARHHAGGSPPPTPAPCAMVRAWPAFAPAAFYGYQRLLQHGACADMYGRAGLLAEAALEAAEARRLLATAHGFGAPCIAGVRFGRNADLVAYSYFVRLGGAKGTDAGTAPTFAGYDRFVHSVWKAPVHGTGAGGHNDDDGRDPLADLRSVLRWCFRAVDPTAATDGDAVFSTFSEIDEANSAVAPAPEDLGPAGLDPRALGLFHCLFDRWIQLRDSTPPSSSPRHDGDGNGEETWLWMQTQERMGLAPTEFLVVLCEMITEAGSSNGGAVALERSPVSYTAFIEQLDALDALEDAALADRFLAHFCAREVLNHRTGLAEEVPPSPTPSVRPNDDHDATVAATSPDTMPTTAAAATPTAGPGLQPNNDDDDEVRSRSARSAVAPSYASSDMSSLRRMARRARHLVRGADAAAAAPHEPPSRLLRRPSLTVSELSERFSESMSISSSRPSLWAPRSGRQQRQSGTSDEWRPRGE